MLGIANFYLIGNCVGFFDSVGIRVDGFSLKGHPQGEPQHSACFIEFHRSLCLPDGHGPAGQVFLK